MPIEQFKDEHNDLLQMRNELVLAIVGRDAQLVASARWRMCRVLLTHLACEEAELYAPLIRAGGSAGTLAQLFLDEHGGLARAFRDHIAGWPIVRVTEDWRGYEREVRTLMQVLVTRIAREEGRLFPLASRRGERFAA